MGAHRHVYGPVPSRRFGLSLGVDLVPRKVCCYDCIYCQVGPTTRKTVRRARMWDPDVVVRQVEEALARGPRPQVITMAGSGEPTLYQGLGAVAAGLRRVSDLPLVLLTNSGLLHQDDVLRDALAFDVVSPSLDAADPETFQRVNRPAAEISFDLMLQGLRALCARLRGECRLEVMLVQGVNDAPASLDALAALAGSLQVDSVELNTVVRPPAHQAQAVDSAALAAARARLRGCGAEVLVPFQAGPPGGGEAPADAVQRVVETVARRPCTRADLAAVLGLAAEEVEGLCDRALAEGLVREVERPGGAYLVAATDPSA